MKNALLALMIFLCACFLSACKKTTGPQAVPLLKPGDRLGKMEIMRSPYLSPHVMHYCEEEALRDGSCLIPDGIPFLRIAYGAVNQTAELLGSTWSEDHWRLFVDGHEVDLPAFGLTFYDEEIPDVRFWNVALGWPTDGRHSVVWSNEVGGRRLEETWIFTVSESYEYQP